MKKYRIPLILFIIGLASKLTYIIIGSEVTPDGVLHEAFGFLAIGHFLLFLSVLIGILIFVWSFIKSRGFA